jgi:hypothetical protein
LNFTPCFLEHVRRSGRARNLAPRAPLSSRRNALEDRRRLSPLPPQIMAPAGYRFAEGYSSGRLFVWRVFVLGFGCPPAHELCAAGAAPALHQSSINQPERRR